MASEALSVSRRLTFFSSSVGFNFSRDYGWGPDYAGALKARVLRVPVREWPKFGCGSLAGSKPGRAAEPYLRELKHPD